MEKLADFFSQAEQQSILAEIRSAEGRTSAEIRIRLEREGGEDPMDVARAAFEALGMRETDLHNGVLFVLAVEDRQFIILGDDGIDARVPEGFWDGVRDTFLEHSSRGELVQGLVAGIRLAGEQLAAFFPRQENDVNELPNAISCAE